MRLTHLTEHKDKRKNREPMLKIRNKLFVLENIEEELGIELITFFKLLKTTKVWAYSNNDKHEITLTGVDPYDKTVNLWNGICHIEYPLNEYGKSFALTKEELL